ncbi:MAG: lipoyl synthase [Deltaproteobacteria bacterium]|nr:lipoyl synthase [Deltaproteobacteria bacterium]
MLKITAGTWRGRKILAPDSVKTRPARVILRQALFNSIQSEISGARVLDLFAGTGTLGFEALSRGASFVVFVESSLVNMQRLKKNAELLGSPFGLNDTMRVIHQRVENSKGFLIKEAPFDFILVDPPYTEGWEEKLFKVLPISELLRSNSGKLFLDWGRQKSICAPPDKPVPGLVKIREKTYGESILTTYGFVPLNNKRDPLSPSKAAQILAEKKPPWLKTRPPGGESYLNLKGLLKKHAMHTVCEEAHCPNLTECWATGTATFMLGGDICTRACRFCAVKTARQPPPLDSEEPESVAESVVSLGLQYVVLTSVDRDDLQDGGATHFAKTIQAIKKRNPKIIVEALVPDFKGDTKAVSIVVDSGVDVYAHNIETVRGLQKRVRDPRAGYEQSLKTLLEAKKHAQARKLITKSSIMLGLGEELSELEEAFHDLRDYGIDVLTLGQYLRPSLMHLPVERYLTPEEFTQLGERAKSYGFLYVASGPMIRSSYRAGEFFIKNILLKESQNVF